MKRIGGPTEDQEQIALFRWLDLESAKYPELQLCFHIGNGGYRTPVEAAKFKRMGVKPGVPDLFLPVARGGYHGLFIELKREKGGRVSDAQRGWIEALRRCGYQARVCHGWDAAHEEILAYLKGGVAE